MNYLEYCIGKEDHGKEVLWILRSVLGLSTTKIRSVKWDPEGILLDGNRVTVRHKVSEGQILRVLKNDSENRQKRVLPCPMDLDILYEDEDLIFLNKPAGMVSHPSMGHRRDSLANGLQAYFDEKRERSSIHLLGRLDKDTSGILGIAKNGMTARIMIQNQAIDKEYLAITEGYLPNKQGIIDIPMEEYRDPTDHLLKMRQPDRPDCLSRASDTASPAKEAVTVYDSVFRCDGFSLARVRIGTGRMHQIRFHMAQISHPLIGDSLYGHGQTGAMTRSALHAHKIVFTHPVSKEQIHLEAKIPKDMTEFIKLNYPVP